jgi:hypothetical protein
MRAISGEAIQIINSGSAAGSAAGRKKATNAASASARSGAPNILLHTSECGPLPSRLRAVCAAVRHSSRCLRETNTRHIERATASAITSASCGRKAM